MTAADPQPGDMAPNLVFVNVKHRGVMGDGITDDTPALQALLDSMSNTTRYEPAEGSVALLMVKPGPVAHQRLGDGHWYSAGEVGRADGLTWVELNRLGDVEVIHHE